MNPGGVLGTQYADAGAIGAALWHPIAWHDKYPFGEMLKVPDKHAYNVGCYVGSCVELIRYAAMQ
jgi:hypothetical protein